MLPLIAGQTRAAPYIKKLLPFQSRRPELRFFSTQGASREFGTASLGATGTCKAFVSAGGHNVRRHSAFRLTRRAAVVSFCIRPHRLSPAGYWLTIGATSCGEKTHSPILVFLSRPDARQGRFLWELRPRLPCIPLQSSQGKHKPLQSPAYAGPQVPELCQGVAIPGTVLDCKCHLPGWSRSADRPLQMRTSFGRLAQMILQSSDRR